MVKKILILIIILIAALSGVVYAFLQQPQFGHMATGTRLAKIQASPHYINGQFEALEPVKNIVKGSQFAATMRYLTEDKKNIVPDKPLPVKKINLKQLDKKQDIVVWLGHSSFYMQLGGKSILIDPVLDNYAAPLSFINKAFKGTDVYKPEDMPNIDVVIISHDHWDHLDYNTIKTLKDKIKDVVCPLGVGEYFEGWGFAPAQIHEQDWYKEIKLADNFSVHILPAQHFSGRLLKKNQTECASFAIVTPQKRVFYSGDSGYGIHFKEIGDMFGSFDLAIMEDGQYNEQWPRIHMMPEQTAQAAADVHAKTVLPAHNGKFALSSHTWYEPYDRLEASSQNKDYKLLTPEIGDLVRIGDMGQKFTKWWQSLE